MLEMDTVEVTVQLFMRVIANLVVLNVFFIIWSVFIDFGRVSVWRGSFCEDL